MSHNPERLRHFIDSLAELLEQQPDEATLLDRGRGLPGGSAHRSPARLRAAGHVRVARPGPRHGLPDGHRHARADVASLAEVLLKGLAHGREALIAGVILMGSLQAASATTWFLPLRLAA